METVRGRSSLSVRVPASTETLVRGVSTVALDWDALMSIEATVRAD
jgi:hypothetical protein